MRPMRFGLMFVSMLLAGVAFAQDNGSGYAYGFGSLGAFSDGGVVTHVGGGFERMLGRNFGVGAALGYMAAVQDMSEGIGLLDVNGSYYFTGDQARWIPFVTGGYTLGFREGAENLFNVGGGINYWWNKRAGMRVEFRDHIYPGNYDGFHQLDFRFGVVFH